MQRIFGFVCNLCDNFSCLQVNKQYAYYDGINRQQLHIFRSFQFVNDEQTDKQEKVEIFWENERFLNSNNAHQFSRYYFLIKMFFVEDQPKWKRRCFFFKSPIV